MKVVFSADAWVDYLGWQEQDPEIAARIDALLQNVRRTPFAGIGKPEPLKGTLNGFWSRRITQEHRLVYRVCGTDADQRVEIASCRKHY